MSVWAQIADDRVTTVPPDGRTTIDIYAGFTFGGSPVPDGTQIQFIVGKGDIPDSAASVADLNNAVSPVDGIQLFSAIGVTQTQFVRDSDGVLKALSVAKATLMPIGSVLKDNVVIIAYSTYDRVGTVSRLAFGGVTLTVSGGEGVFASAIERYDPIGNAWAAKASMPTGRSGLFCENVSNKIYAIGGFNGNFTNVNEMYDPATDTWTTMAPMSIARGFGPSVVVGNKIFVIGGYNFDPGRASAVVERFDPALGASGTWTTMAPMLYPVAFSTAQVVGTKIYVFYGATQFDEKDNPKSFNNGVQVYDTVGDSWSYSNVALPSPASTSLTANAAVGDFSIAIGSSAGLQATGFVTISGSETVRYVNFQNGSLLLSSPLAFSHSAGAPVVGSSMSRVRLSPNSFVKGSVVSIFNGFDGAAVNGLVETFDTSTKISLLTASSSNLPRYKAGQARIGTTEFIVGGSSPAKSDYLGQVEEVDTLATVFSGPSPFAKMSIFRTSFGCVAANDGISDFVYALGGLGSGHSAGWLKIDAKATPENVRADGVQTASVVVTAVDASGDKAPDGINLKVRGLIYLPKPQDAATTSAVQSSTGSPTTTQQERNPVQTVSLLPVLFSAKEFMMVGGEGATALLPRSEDFINEVQNLLNFAKGNEKAPSEQALKAQAQSFANENITIGEQRSLYKVAIEIIVDSPFYFGQTDTDATAANVPDQSLGSGAFSFNPPSAKQGPSASVSYFSDIASVPDIQFVTDSPVDYPALVQKIAEIRENIPFGASPHYDALVAGAAARIVPPLAMPLLPPTNIMVSASDNENSGSASTAADVAEEVNLVAGAGKFPVFITTVVVTDPISLAARAARTDVADLELISSDTGGSSFSLDSPQYVNFIIDRIKTSAPASIGSGSITVRHQVNGAISLFRIVVDNMVSGNSAVLTARSSVDGYNFIDLGVRLSAPNGAGPQAASFALVVPARARFVEYTVNLSSKNFDSPVLTSVSIQYVQPNVQYLFTYPQNVHGQVSELAAVTNECLPPGSKIEVGVSHGASTEFERDYESHAQPSIQQRGTIVAVNRSFGTVLNGTVFRDILRTIDNIIYLSEEGPWSLDAITRIFVNQAEALPADFIAVPEEGKIVFRKKLATSDVVAMEIENVSQFRVGLRIENPSLQTGVLDSFAFMYGETALANGLKPNRPPVATNLFISSPVFAGGPLKANYTYIDPDGDPEDATQTQIIWFRNGSPVTGLTGKTVSNSDLIATRADASKDNLISKGQEWFFTVRPSDGQAFGPLAVSPSLKIGNSPPVTKTAFLTSSNADISVFTSSDTITVNYDFSDLDGDLAAGSVIAFSVNGLVVKTGTETTLSPTEEDDAGNKFIKAGNTILATVTPSDGTDFGDPISTAAVSIGGSVPSVANASILPTQPTAASSLVLSYQFISLDKSPDQSQIAWFANDVRLTDFDNIKTIPRGNLKPGQSWYAIVTPSDGASQGSPVKSNVVLVQF